MTRDIDPGLLRAFTTVADTGSMTVAGRHLNLTQAAVSQQIKRLEELFGLELFERRHRELSLTSAGERLVAQAERILALNDETFGMMTAPDFEGEIRLGVPHDIVGAFLPSILRNFARTWPRVNLSLVCKSSVELRRQLDDGALDLALTTEHDTAPEGERLLADRLVWLGAEGGDAYRRRPLPVTLGDDQCAFRRAAVNVLGKAGIDWRFICSSGDTSAMVSTIQADLAVLPLLSQTVPPGLVVLGPEDGLPTLPIYYINLFRGRTAAGTIANKLADDISRSFGLRYPQAA